MPDQPPHAETRIRDAERRRSERVLLVVPLEVSWEREGGGKVKDHAETEMVSAHGALLRTKSQLTGVKEIELTRAHPHLVTKAQVMNTYPPGADGMARVAVELSVPSHEFWGLVIPESQEPAPAVARTGTPEPQPAASTPEPKKAIESPRKRQVALRVPMRIRTPEGATEVCKTESLSKEEARFLSEKDYPGGATLFVAAPYTPGEDPLEVKATVESLEEVKDSPKKLYRIKFDRAAKKDSA